MTRKLYRVRLATPGASSVRGNVDFTLSGLLGGEVPVPGAQVIRPLQGRTESQPWVARVVDKSGQVTAKLFDVAGRMTALGRLADLQVATDDALRIGSGILNYAIRAVVGTWPTSDLTVEFWGKLDAGLNKAQSNTGFSYAEAANFNEIVLELTSTGTQWRPQLQVNGGAITSATDFPDDNEWHHFLARWRTSDGSAQIFIDGVLDTTGTIAVGAITGGGCLVLGQDQDSLGGGFDATQTWKGALDHVRVYSRYVTDVEAAEHYVGIFRDETALRLKLGFDDPVARGQDASGTGNHVDIIGGCSYVDGAFVTVATARLVDVDQTDEVASYDLTFQDERWIERNTRIWTKGNTVSLYPAGIIDGFGSGGGLLMGPVKGPFTVAFTVIGIGGLTPEGNTIIGLAPPVNASTGQISLGDPQTFLHPGLKDWLIKDLKPNPLPKQTAGNFQHLRFHRMATSEDLTVLTFDTILAGTTKLPANTFVESWKADPTVLPIFWVVWVGSAPSVGSTHQGFLRPKDYEASDELPIHVQGAGAWQFLVGNPGKHPLQLVKDDYDGLNSADGRTVRYDPAAFQTLLDDPSFGVGWWRPVAPEVMATWHENNVFGPYGVVPFIDAQGRVAPRKMHLPQGIDPTTLFEFTAAVCLEAPRWYTRGREVATVVVAEYEALTGALFANDPASQAFDKLDTIPIELRRRHDRVSQLGEVEVAYAISGVHAPDLIVGPLSEVTGMGVTRLVDRLARETFDRYGDGPQYGGVLANVLAAAVQPGDFVRMTVTTYPNAAIQARGGTRIVQIISRQPIPEGFHFEWLDAGPNLQPPAAPVVAVVLNAGNGRHAVDVTVSSIAVGDGYEVQVAASTGAPSSTSPLWRPAFSKDAAGATSEVTTVQPLPSGTSLWWRAVRKNPLRIRSAWSSSVNVTTTALPTPTIVAVTAPASTEVQGSWTNPAIGEDYPVEVLLDAGSSSPTTHRAELSPRSTYHKIGDLAASTTYAFGVRYFDPWGGKGPVAFSTAATGGSVLTCPDMAGVGLAVLWDAVTGGRTQ